jgi:ferritin-like metal-binding protein YciE
MTKGEKTMETAQERMVRYLDDAWAVEKALVNALDSMANEVTDPVVRALFEEHRIVTHQQEENLEARIRALGEEPSGTKGFFSSMMSRIGELLHRPYDDYDQVTQDLMKQYGVENFEMAMYESMAVYAEAIGDTASAQLAREHLAQERETAERVWKLIAPAAAHPAEMYKTATAA